MTTQVKELVSEIRYITRFNQNRNTSKTITHASLDSKSPEFFKSGFAEMIPSTGERRLFFDVELNSYKESWLKDVISWLDTLAEVLKTRYAACGYTTDEDFMTEYEEDEDIQNKLMLDFKSDKTLTHAISFHVIFQKVFETKDLFKVLCNPNCIYVKEGVDMSVYKDENKQQLLRHAFSIKNKSLTDICHTEIDFTYIQQLFKASELVATPYGSEEVGTLEELKEAFVYEESKSVEKIIQKSISAALTKTQTKPKNDDDDVDDVDDDVEFLLKTVCNPEFKHKSTLHDINAFIPKSKNVEMNYRFLSCFNKIYNSVAHSTPENIENLYHSRTYTHGFCSCMSNIKNAYYNMHNYELIQKLRKESKNQAKACKFTDAEREELKRYKQFSQAYHNVINQYFDQYDYIHTTANEEKFLEREDVMKNQDNKMSNQYKRLYVRKVLYICDTNYIYRKSDFDTKSYSLDYNAFQKSLRRIYALSTIDDRFNKVLKVFKNEDLLESSDGLIYPRYRDMIYKECLTDEEFKHFETAYKATFKDQDCADLALNIMIQDIASGFHDNSSIIKFYFGTGGNNKTCESLIYQNIIGSVDLVFNTHKLDILTDEKNQPLVSCVYCTFDDMPLVNKDRFIEFTGAMKNYNECGKKKTRGMFKDFVTINCNIRFQCNTNEPLLRDWLLDSANDAIKRRFLVAERIHSDEYSDWLYDFCHSVEQCKALKMYIKMHKDALYFHRLCANDMLKFYKDHEDIYAKYTEARVNDEFEDFKNALCRSGCVTGKRTPKSGNEYIADIKEWHREFTYLSTNLYKTETTFRNKVKDYCDYCKNCYVNGKRVSGKWFIKNVELIAALDNYKPNIDFGEDDVSNT